MSNEVDLLDGDLTTAAISKKSLSGELFVKYVFHGLLTAAVPIYLYYTIFKMSGQEYIPIYSVVSIITAILLGISFHNIYRNVDFRLSADRADVITSNLVSGTKEQKKQLLTDLRKRTSSVTSNESLSLSIIYNSLFFLALFVLFGFLVFKTLPGIYNYPLSTILAASAVMLASRI